MTVKTVFLCDVSIWRILYLMLLKANKDAETVS